MSPQMETPPPEDDDDLLAGEYVLGALDLAERATVEARLRSDTGLAAKVMAWENRLSDLNESFAPAALPDLMPKIEARLCHRTARLVGRSAAVGRCRRGLDSAGRLSRAHAPQARIDRHVEH
jgi:anti-sigma-K factor RskA